MNQRRNLVSKKSSFSIRRQCDLLSVNRSSLYFQPKQESSENLALMRLMDEYFMSHPSYGVLQMQDYLRSKGYMVNHKRVRRLLRKMGIMAIYPKKNLSKLLYKEYVHPYLLRGLKVSRPNQVWAIDITYIPMKKGFMYLTAIIDLYSRFVVGWTLSNTLEADVCTRLLDSAIAQHGLPGIVNSDQGSGFTCHNWIETLGKKEIRISMDGKGRALDNVFIERLWGTVKRDYVYLNPASDGLELYQGLEDFFENYNYRKTHQGIGRKIPYELYSKSKAA